MAVRWIPLLVAPEPNALCVVGTGVFMVLAYAWRKRR
jgi:hypothetical protein